MFYVYAIFNITFDKIYVGQTEDISACIEAHRNKTFNNSYTARFDGEWKLIYQETVATRHEALIRERQLKTFRGRQFIKSICELRRRSFTKIQRIWKFSITPTR